MCLGAGIGFTHVDLSSGAAGGEWTPSPRIFRRAEFVRSLLEEEITDMFGEMVSPGTKGC